MNPQAVAVLAFVSTIATVFVVIGGMVCTKHHIDKLLSELRAHMDSQFDLLEQRFRAIEESSTRL